MVCKHIRKKRKNLVTKVVPEKEYPMFPIGKESRSNYQLSLSGYQWSNVPQIRWIVLQVRILNTNEIPVVLANPVRKSAPLPDFLVA